MNVAKVLSERMKSPGAISELRDRTSNPAALSQVGDAKTGSDKQEPWPLNPEDQEEFEERDGHGSISDAGLGMLESAHASAHGDRKADYHKALEHAHRKKEAAMPGYQKRGAAPGQSDRMGGKYDGVDDDRYEHERPLKGKVGMEDRGHAVKSYVRPYESRESRAGGMPGKGIFKRTGV